MAATPDTASEGPGASMAEPCGDCLWARPSWHGPRRTAEARAPLGSPCRQGWRLISPGSPGAAMCPRQEVQDTHPRIETPEAQGGLTSGVLLQNLELLFQSVFQLQLPGKPGRQNEESYSEKNKKSLSRVILTYSEKTFIVETLDEFFRLLSQWGRGGSRGRQ